MSGIVGIVQFDGSPVDPALLRRLTDSLAFRGPDNRQIWVNNNVGFGHALFETTEESERDCQPLNLDGRNWITADARIDAREDLFAALRSAGESDLSDSIWTDAELILRAYRVWGENCVERLRGDFAFGIWDDSRQQLFCARDHMGVKPFYYAQIGSCLMFSNTLDCIRQHPCVSDKLNEQAIADFLLFELNQDRATTSFLDIRRLPPAHCASGSRDGFSIRHYWSMPIDEPIFYKRAEDYIDHFHDLLRKSVADRLRTNRVGIFMSGGIDSPTLAFTANELLRRRYANFELQALTHVDSFAPDERRYAGMVARHLGIPIEYRHRIDTNDCDWEHVPFSLPEPSPDACVFASERQFWSQIQSYSRVFFHGEGPDNALLPDWYPYVSHLVRHRRHWLLLRNIFSTMLSERRPPFWGRIINKVKDTCAFGNDQPGYPKWFNPALESRLNLRERWNTIHAPWKSLHPIRPDAYASLQIPLWQFLFERFDPGVTKASFEVRHPFVDIRMLRFFLAVPPLPWCRSKYLLRRALRGRLPKEVLRRKKATIDARTVRRFLLKLCVAPFIPTPEICNFIDPGGFGFPGPNGLESNLAVRSLNHWLQNSHRSSHNPPGNFRDQFTSDAARAAAQEALSYAKVGSLRRPEKTHERARPAWPQR